MAEATGNGPDGPQDVWVNTVRTGTELGYTKDAVQGDRIKVTCTNPDTGQVSTTDGLNRGFAVVTFPDGYHGRCDVEIEGSDGGLATGSITV